MNKVAVNRYVLLPFSLTKHLKTIQIDRSMAFEQHIFVQKLAASQNIACTTEQMVNKWMDNILIRDSSQNSPCKNTTGAVFLFHIDINTCVKEPVPRRGNLTIAHLVKLDVLGYVL